ncbi:MAG: mechanosensitive ion channel protein [Candidatus Cloacimonetes bacterium 4572_55]|nr:MAG: mechanosensitive ion channel protein [Candidatus Cloacimonetes bacterium 4572_55]
MVDFWGTVGDMFWFYIFKLIGSIAIFFIGKWIAGLLKAGVKLLMLKSKVNDTLANFTVNFMYFGLLIVVMIAALSNLGIQTASFVAIIGAAGLAVGLALQGSLSNFAAGVMIIIFSPYKIDDFVEIGDASGWVKEIEIFNTTLKTPDNKIVILPNSTITGGKITNYSTEKIRRVDLVFGIGYGDDLADAKTILTELLKADERILSDPAPVVAVLELGDNSVNFAVRPFVKTEDYWDVFFDLNEKVKLKFDDQGISIPYPQQDVHLHQPQTEEKTA